ncbi:MAG: hypothetical protein R3F56_08910 [Planctomycetota bacterium]
MNTIVNKLGLVLLPLALLCTGCDQKEAHGAGGRKLALTAPVDQSLKQGATNDVAVKIDRNDFTGPVTIDFVGLPPGVSVANPGPILAGDESKDFTLRATETAAVVNDHVVTVTASAADMRVQQTFKIDVEAR